jgi:hypothetical protein
MAGILWRVLIAVIAVVLTFALIPPVAHVLGFAIDGDVYTIIRICVAGLAIFYIIRGPAPPWST